MARIYIESVSPGLHRGHTLIFSSAYNLTYGLIEAPPSSTSGWSRRGPLCAAVRERFLTGESYASFVAVAQEASRNAWEVVLAVAKGMGALLGGAVEVGFEQETELDLFLQQAVLPLFHRAVITAAQLLLEAGYSRSGLHRALSFRRDGRLSAHRVAVRPIERAGGPGVTGTVWHAQPLRAPGDAAN
ncbi:MAG: hypothetical protein IPK19_12905 [Chloroflexi bacterium]|nr:hypothetical protein [Chloroflexota bacterium]